MRKTKIICTLGPACSEEATLRALLRGGMDVRQAGEQCGIENDSYFSALFKRIMGVTPKQYRLQSAAFPENGR